MLQTHKNSQHWQTYDFENNWRQNIVYVFCVWFIGMWAPSIIMNLPPPFLPSPAQFKLPITNTSITCRTWELRRNIGLQFISAQPNSTTLSTKSSAIPFKKWQKNRFRVFVVYLEKFTSPPWHLQHLHHQTVSLQINGWLKAYFTLGVEMRVARRPIDIQVKHVFGRQHDDTCKVVILQTKSSIQTKMYNLWMIPTYVWQRTVRMWLRTCETKLDLLCNTNNC